MRISVDKVKVLKESILKRLPAAKIYLFGSKVNDSAKGGDVDILILANRKLDWKEKGDIKYEFYQKFGEQKIDLVSFTFGDDAPFKEIALMEAVEL